MIELARLPIFIDDLIVMAETLPDHEYNLMMLAVLHNAKDGTLPKDLPETLTLSFNLCKAKNDAARNAYARKCTTNAQNGGKGGKAKAANAAKAQQLPPDPTSDAAFKPPSETRFVAIVQNFVNEGAIPEVDKKDAKDLFTKFQANDWTIKGEPIRFMDECENAIFYHFCEGDPLPPGMRRFIYATIFSDFHGLRNAKGVSKAADAESDFFDCFDADQRIWNIHGKQYASNAWHDALADFMTTYKT